MNGPTRKPRADIYTALLALALAAVIVATIFAYLETSDYGEQKYQGAPLAPSLAQTAPVERAPCLATCERPGFRFRVFI